MTSACTGACKAKAAPPPRPGEKNYWRNGGVQCKACKTYLSRRTCPCDTRHYVRSGGKGAPPPSQQLVRQKIPKIEKKSGISVKYGGKSKKTKRAEEVTGEMYRWTSTTSKMYNQRKFKV